MMHVSEYNNFWLNFHLSWHINCTDFCLGIIFSLCIFFLPVLWRKSTRLVNCIWFYGSKSLYSHVACKKIKNCSKVKQRHCSCILSFCIGGRKRKKRRRKKGKKKESRNKKINDCNKVKLKHHSCLQSCCTNRGKKDKRL